MNKQRSKSEQWTKEIRDTQKKTGLSYRQSMIVASKLRKLKNEQWGGLYNKSLQIIPLPRIQYELKNPKIVGFGGYGIIVVTRLNAEELATKLIQTESDCKKAQTESTIHNEVYQAFQELKQYLGDYDPYKILHIPKPISYAEHIGRKVKIGDQVAKTSCSYGMEYMIPLNIKLNIHDNQPIQLHISASDVPRLVGYRGYMIGVGRLDSMLETLNQYYPNYKKPSSSIAIYTSIGIALGCSIFGCHYNPKDLQFMLSEYNGEIKVVGFDFGMFEKFSDFGSHIIDSIFYEMLNSPYIGVHWTDNIDAMAAMLTGIAVSVKPLVKLYGEQCDEYIGFVELFKKFYDREPILWYCATMIDALVKN